MNSSNVTGSPSDPLLNASLTTGLGPTTGDTTEAPQAPLPSTPKTLPESKRSATDVAPSEFQVYEGVDVLTDSGRVVVQQFIAEQRWGRKDYQADPRQPILVMPDPDGATGPQPFEPSWQKATIKFFREQVKEALINKFKESGGSTAFLQEFLQKFQESGETIASLEAFLQGGIIGKESTPLGVGKKPGQSGGKETGAGAEKEAGASAEKEAIPQLPAPVVEAVVNTIAHAIATNKVSNLSKDGQEIVAAAAQKTQKAWKLPDSWTNALVSDKPLEVKDWTPVTTEVVAPINIDVSRRELLAQGFEKLATSIENVGKKMMAEMPPNDPNRIAVGDLIKVLSQAIRDLKEVLQKMRMLEADASIKESKAKFESIKDKDDQIRETAKKIDEAAEARAKQARTSKIMKIIAPIISVIVIAIGVIALPFTAGGSTALIVAGLVIASVMLAYTILDTAFDITSKVIGAFNDMLEKAFPDKPWARTLIKAFAAAVLVTVLVVAIVASGGAAAGPIGGTIAGQIAVQVTTQLVINFAIQYLMASNIIPELVNEILIKSGLLDSKNEMAKMIISMIVSFVVMVLTMVAVAKGAGGGALKSVGNTISEGAKAVGRTVADFGRAIVKLATIATEQGLKAAIAELQQMLAQLMRLLGQLIKQGIAATGTAIGNAIDKVKTAAKEFGQALTSAKDSLKASIESAKETITRAAERFMEALKNLDKVLLDAAKKASEQALSKLKEIAQSTADALRDFGKGLKELDPRPNFKNMLEGLKDIFDPRAVLSSNKGAAEWQKIARQAQDITKLIGLSVEVGGSIYIGVVGLQLVNILKQLGELEKAQEVTQLLIKLFQKLLDSFQEGLSAKGEWINSLDQALSSIFGSASQTLTKATQQALA